MRLAYAQDFPPRPDWPLLEYMVQEPQALQEATARKVLKYSKTEFRAARALLRIAGETGGAMVSELLRGRMEGSPDAATALAKLAEQSNRPEEARDRYRVLVDQGADEWEPYNNLGRLLIEVDQDYGGAARVFESYPGFKGKDGNAVALGNFAYEAGSMLFWRGEIDSAVRLYRIAVGIPTGSAANMASAQRLQLLDGDYVGAARWALNRGKRYNNDYGLRDYLALLHTMGLHNEAWAGFLERLQSSDAPHIWMSALVGHQMQRQPGEQVRAWLDETFVRGSYGAQRQNAAKYALMWNMVDRMPDAKLAEWVAHVEGPPQEKAHGLVVVVAAQGERPGVHVVGPSRLRAAQGEFAPGEAVPSGLALFAEAYGTLRRGEHDRALAAFERLATYRYVETGPMAYALPYYAYAAARSGNGRTFEDRLASIENSSSPFDLQLARAFLTGLRGETAVSVRHLNKAFAVRPHTEDRPLPTEYQYAEACEWLYRDTGKKVFRDLVLDWARKHQRIQPMFGWAYAMEAKLTDNAQDRTRALAIALYLDPDSERISGMPESEIAKAQKWLAANNPFVLRDPDDAPRTGI